MQANSRIAGTGEVRWAEMGVTCRIEASEAGVCGVRFDHVSGERGVAAGSAIVEEAAAQLAAYFAGRLTRFDLPLDLAGTDFQRDVWALLLAIPYGETVTYADIAARLGRPSATRAVGTANGANPVPVIVPCHRVVRTGGALGGYGGGLPIKRALLDLEFRHAGLFAGWEGHAGPGVPAK